MLSRIVPSNRALLRSRAPVWVACWLLGPTVLLGDDLNERFESTIRPLLTEYCIDCHGEDGAEADLSLESFTSAQQVRDHRNTWLSVLGQLRAKSMPPADMDQPTQQERAC